MEEFEIYEADDEDISSHADTISKMLNQAKEDGESEIEIRIQGHGEDTGWVDLTVAETTKILKCFFVIFII